MPPLIYMLRHGQTDWNAESRLQGQENTDITALGQAQADRNGKLLAGLIRNPENFDFVASPLNRTRETMERVRAAMDLPAKDYRTDERLLELHFGDWQGFTYDELEARQPGVTLARARDKWNFLPPGKSAESYAVLARRVSAWLADVKRQTVCVTHGGVVRSMFVLLEGMAEEEAAMMTVPQDRILKIAGGRLEWL